MDQISDKVAHCFSLVFPDMNPSEYYAANTENTSAWDSLAQVTLLSLLGQEFGIEIDYEQFEDANSFEVLTSRIRELSAGA